MGKKYEHSFVKDAFEKEGYILLSISYKNNKTKLNCLCPKGHNHSVNFNNWVTGYRCRKCLDIRTGNRLRSNFNDIKKLFIDNNYILLLEENEYKSVYQKLKTICPSGHIYYTTQHNFKYNGRCRECSNLNRLLDGNPNWQGGKSFEPYCHIWSDKGYKEDIKQRDNYVCRNPCCFNDSNVLCLHHIDYDKKNCHPMNLITVCRNCNTRANYNREWHQEWYQTLMSNRTNNG
jgi:hypothetical protein